MIEQLPSTRSPTHMLHSQQALKFVQSAQAGAGSPAGQLTQDEEKVVEFAGSLWDLLKLCHNVEAATTIDLGEATVEGIAHAESSKSEGGSSFLPALRGSVEGVDSEQAKANSLSMASDDGASPSMRLGASHEGSEEWARAATQATPPRTIVGAPDLMEHRVNWSASSASKGKLQDETAGQSEVSGLLEPAVSGTDDVPPMEVSSETTCHPWSMTRAISIPCEKDAPSLGDDAALLLSTPSEAYVRWRQLDDSANTCSIRLEAECVEDALWDDSNAPLFVLLQSRGVTIRNGTLRLPAGYMLLLEGLVAMVNLSIVSSDEADAEGSASSTAHRLPPLVFVSQASVTMENVTVGPNCAGYGIGVGDGGNLELCDCAVSGQRSSGLVVRGASANLLAERCRFEQNGQDGVHVLEGATASLFSCHFVANRAMGFGVGHETSVALLSECCSERNEFGFVGHNGGMLTLQDCSSSHNKNGVHAMDGATMVRGVGGALAINQQGVHVGEGAQVHLSDTRISDNGTGCFVSGRGSKLDVEECLVAQSEKHGIHVLSGSTCSLSDTIVTGNGAHGVIIEHRHSHLVARASELCRNGNSGVSASLMATVELNECSLVSNKVAGVHASLEGTKVAAKACKLSENGTIGIFLNKGACARIVGGDIEGNGSSGCEVRDRHSCLKASRTAIIGNGRVGLYVHTAASAACHRCRIMSSKACDILCGGRKGSDLGGGTVALQSCQLDQDAQPVLRHGGRLFGSPTRTPKSSASCSDADSAR